MRHLNYNHLFYFWTVVREGSIARASETLHLTPQTISGQLKMLEETIGEPLFQRVGRGLVPTELGNTVQEYAEEIFSLGGELAQRTANPGTLTTLNVGLVNSIAKLISYRIIQPAISADDGQKIVCTEGDLESLLGELAVHRLDLVISDRPVPTGMHVKAFSHELGYSDIAFFARSRAATRLKRNFPASLDQQPMLMPAHKNALRRVLDDWFDQLSVTPRIVAEFDDSALLKAFGQAGMGAFPAPAAITDEVERQYHVTQVGTTTDVRETYYAISPERRIKHPAVAQITETARETLFA